MGEEGGLKGDWRVPTLEGGPRLAPRPLANPEAGFQERRDWQRWDWSQGCGVANRKAWAHLSGSRGGATAPGSTVSALAVCSRSARRRPAARRTCCS